MMGSDENARPADDSIGRCHPRGFGSAARFLRLRLDAGSPIEAAVRQMTGLAAETFQLADRGLVRPGSAPISRHSTRTKWTEPLTDCP